MSENKAKNPLYVVKGENVEIAKNYFDLILKKLNLEAWFNYFKNLITELMKIFPPHMVVEKANHILKQMLETISLFVGQKSRV